MEPLGTGLDYFDLRFLGETAIIATGLLSGREGVAIIDPGPSTTLPKLRAALAARGASAADVLGILLTHIHLDHAGAAGTAGAPHLVDPSKLLVSAGRLYGADMDRLWGEVRPVPAERIQIAGEGTLKVVGHAVEIAKTPGHASHHVSFFLPNAGVAFVGDTAGICRSSGRIVLPPTPPPDIDLEAWRVSTRRILAWHPDVLFLTHFGPHHSPRGHFDDMWSRLDDWSARIRAQFRQPGDDDARARAFTDEVMRDLTRATSRQEAEAYAHAARFDFSWAGLARYLKKSEVRSQKSEVDGGKNALR